MAVLAAATLQGRIIKKPPTSAIIAPSATTSTLARTTNLPATTTKNPPRSLQAENDNHDSAVTTTTIDEFPDLSCNIFRDSCPTMNNGICDRDDNTDNNTGRCSTQDDDCLDCDECPQFAANCQACLAHHCHWCPGDATCYNSNYYQPIGRLTSCPQPDDFVQATPPPSSSINNVVVEEMCQAGAGGAAPTKDPLYAAQSWVLDAIDVRQVWDMGYTGQGVRVRINDSGVEASHAEFAGRFDVEASCKDDYLPSGSDASSPEHGTSVAGIVGGARDNGVCSVGVAPDVTLSSCNVFSSSLDFLDPSQISRYDIANQSFGDVPCESMIVKSTTSSSQNNNDNGGVRRHLQTCPFQAKHSRLVHPCNVCDFSTAPPTDILSSTTTTTIPMCQSALIQHCATFWESDQEPCVDVLPLLVQDGQCRYSSFLSRRVQEGLQRLILQGRNGKGIIVVTAAGNSYRTGGHANVNGYATSRFTIVVGAVDKYRGQHASYSLAGTSVFVAAPGGDGTAVANHVTASLNGQCADAGIGTSYSCPVVSGVIALLLQARPELTWRDVQGILAISSTRVVDDDDDTTAIINAANYWHSDYYGFGVVNAFKAMQTALAWTLLPSESMLVAESGVIDAILEDDALTTTRLSLTMESRPPPNNKNDEEESSSMIFFTEAVQILIQLDHLARGHLEIVLTSPGGTSSLLHPGKRPEYTQLEDSQDWILLTLKSWGENPMGEWTLELTDLVEGDRPGAGCNDANWFIDQNNNLDPVSCRLLEQLGACGNGQVNPNGAMSRRDLDFLMNQEYDGRLPAEACCACGGSGISRDEIGPDQLRQWTLVVYGHWKEPDGREGNDNTMTTDGPSSTPTIMNEAVPPPPTASPVTLDEFFLPTVAPTSDPTSNLVDSSSSSSPTESSSTQDPIDKTPTQTPSMTPTAGTQEFVFPTPLEEPSSFEGDSSSAMATACDVLLRSTLLILTITSNLR